MTINWDKCSFAGGEEFVLYSGGRLNTCAIIEKIFIKERRKFFQGIWVRWGKKF